MATPKLCFYFLKELHYIPHSVPINFPIPGFHIIRIQTESGGVDATHKNIQALINDWM